MPCDAIENRIPEYLENQLSRVERSSVATHLESCAECRALARQLEKLDAALLDGVKPPALSAGFGARLQERVRNTVVWSDTERAERKRRLQAEYDAGLARLRPFAVSRRLLNGLGFAALFATLGWFGVQFLPQTMQILATLGLAELGPNLASALVASAIFVGIGFAAAFPRRLRILAR
jgi:anti-sigma factor RsiW